MQVFLKSGLQQDIFRHLEASFPNEGGGFLLGTLTDGSVQISDVIAIDNVFAEEEQYHRYAMTPQDWMRLEDEADARGLSLVGYYHSHPNAAPIPSIFDRDHALPHFTYLITQVQEAKAVEMRAWRLRDDRSEFDAETLTVSG